MQPYVGSVIYLFVMNPSAGFQSSSQRKHPCVSITLFFNFREVNWGEVMEYILQMSLLSFDITLSRAGPKRSENRRLWSLASKLRKMDSGFWLLNSRSIS